MSKKTGFGKLVKQLLEKEIKRDIEGSRNVFVAQFSNISVNSMFELRRNLRKTRAEFLVVKNSIARRVLGRLPFKGLVPLVNGQCGLSVTDGDTAKVSKILATFSEENAGFKISGAYMEGALFSVDMVKQLAMLPSREELLAKIAGGMKAPIQGFVSVLGQLTGGLVNVLEQIRKSKEGKS